MILRQIRLFSCLISLCVITVSAYGEEIPSDPVAFTNYMVRQMTRELGDWPVALEEPLVLLVGMCDTKISLYGIFEYCKSNVQDCPAKIASYVGGSKVLKEKYTPPKRGEIRLVLRPVAYLKHSDDLLGRGPVWAQSKYFASNLVFIPVVETPEGIRALDDRDMSSLSLGTDDLIARAGEITARISMESISDLATPVKPGQIGTITGSIFYSGLVALPSRWAELASAQGGHLLISLPSTDTILYFSESSPEAVDALRALAKHRMTKAANPLSNAVFRWTEGGWKLVE